MLKRQIGLLMAITGLCLSMAYADEKCCAANQYAQPSAGTMPQNAPGTISQIQWMTNFQQAADRAKKENKYLVLFFTGSDWCGWCKKIDSEVFSDPAFASSAGNQFVFFEADFPMNRMQTPELTQQNAELKQRFGISGFPTIIVLDPNLNFVAETGYRPGGGAQFASYLIQLTQRQAG